MSLGSQVAWVSLPGEVFTELGQMIKIDSPFPFTIVDELVNDYLDYVPNRKAYEEGAYEVVTARCLAGSGEAMVNAAVDLLARQYAGLPGTKLARRYR